MDKQQLELIQIIQQYGPYDYFATLTFQYHVSEFLAKEMASILVRRMNKRLLGRRYDKSNSLRGVAVLEKNRIIHSYWKQDRGNCHFHFLIKRPSIDVDPEQLMGRVEGAFRSAALGLNLGKSKKAVSRNGVNLQLITDFRVYEYVAKEAWHHSWAQDERLFLLDGNGLV